MFFIPLPLLFDIYFLLAIAFVTFLLFQGPLKQFVQSTLGLTIPGLTEFQYNVIFLDAPAAPMEL